MQRERKREILLRERDFAKVREREGGCGEKVCKREVGNMFDARGNERFAVLVMGAEGVEDARR